MTDDLLLYNARLCTWDGIQHQGWLHVAQGRIAAMGQGELPVMPNARQIDLDGLLLAPGLIDLHVHGAMGHDTMDATPEALQAIARFNAQHGVTALLATTMTAPAAAIQAALENIAPITTQRTDGAQVLGAHVEGPFINREARGCQDPDLVRDASPEEYRVFFRTGVVRLITLAPEYAENRDLIGYARDQGAVVAAGHTRASYEEIRLAVSLGVRQITHLFNAMSPLHHREPGPVGAALTLESLDCQLIADGIHIHPAVLKLAVRARGPEHVLLVTDAMSGAGMPDGEYELGGLRVTVIEGAARIASGALAGSTLTMEHAVANIIEAADVSLLQALRMASYNPARALGLAEHKGSLAPGMDADLVALTNALAVRLTVVGGEIVFEA